jgi:hypothetical protein
VEVAGNCAGRGRLFTDTERVTNDFNDDIEPDTADWTWVLERACPDCGFLAATFDATLVGAALRENAAAWRVVLEASASAVTERRVPGRWSDLEYAAHVRDVFRLYLARLQLMLTVEDPLFDNWDQDQTAIESRYREQDPVEVSRDLDAAAQLLADACRSGRAVAPSRSAQ